MEGPDGQMQHHAQHQPSIQTSRAKPQTLGSDKKDNNTSISSPTSSPRLALTKLRRRYNYNAKDEFNP